MIFRPKYITFDCYGTLTYFPMHQVAYDIYEGQLPPEQMRLFIKDFSDYRFDEVMEVAARAVQVEVTLPWYFQMKKFYGEEWSEDPEEVEPQHLAPGDATLILQTLKACSPVVSIAASRG